jgi:hypothetical protein
MASPIPPRTQLDTAQLLVPAESFPPGPSAILIENISLYEVDMIPFFNYFTSGEIDQSINTQFYSVSPKIEMGQKDFEFVDDSRLTVPYEILLQQNPSIEITNRETTSTPLSIAQITSGQI